MITGLNHITIAVSDVKRSVEFYTAVLGFNGHAMWEQGAYLSCDNVWLCLSRDLPEPARDYTHIAWSVSQVDFLKLSQKIISSRATLWKVNKSEGESLYFLDPDGHKLEIHVGDLKQRLASLKDKPYTGLMWL
ncbi:fosfomycin resistance glutathione transferase [Alteromonas sp. ASW11-130]|uniref:fosfomycin resistance glutathione transferase n=1 Tax=Alteromonas sp. ASW11-130 TaxID=3015775 RepID=UPI002241A61D|nr:fosfomycin resistance glutathione transferase [Alteromonas sp. ASW11-130]MCW8092906.1 fosfomycin resistance glutathione transferase [Alteromonas sp. ASW11-130]